MLQRLHLHQCLLFFGCYLVSCQAPFKAHMHVLQKLGSCGVVNTLQFAWARPYVCESEAACASRACGLTLLAS